MWANLTKQALAEIQATGLLAGYDPGEFVAEPLLTVISRAYLLSLRRDEFRQADRAMVFSGPPSEAELSRLVALFDPPPLREVKLFRVNTVDPQGNRFLLERMKARLPNDQRVTFDYRTFVEIERFINRLLGDLNHVDRLYALHESESYDAFIVLALNPVQASVMHHYKLLEVGDDLGN